MLCRSLVVFFFFPSFFCYLWQCNRPRLTAPFSFSFFFFFFRTKRRGARREWSGAAGRAAVKCLRRGVHGLSGPAFSHSVYILSLRKGRISRVKLSLSGSLCADAEQVPVGRRVSKERAPKREAWRGPVLAAKDKLGGPGTRPQPRPAYFSGHKRSPRSGASALGRRRDIS